MLALDVCMQTTSDLYILIALVVSISDGWRSVLFLCAGIAIMVYGADEAINRVSNLSRFFRLSVFVASVVIAGTAAVLPELSIGVISAVDGTSSFGLGVVLGSNVADPTLVVGVVVLVAGKLK